MGRVAVDRRARPRCPGYALAGAAGPRRPRTPAAVRGAWAALPADVEVVILTPAAAAGSRCRPARHEPAHGGDAVVTADAPPRHDRAGARSARRCWHGARADADARCSPRPTPRPPRLATPAPRTRRSAILAEARAQGESDAAALLATPSARGRAAGAADVLARRADAVRRAAAARAQPALPGMRAETGLPATWRDALARAARTALGARRRASRESPDGGVVAEVERTAGRPHPGRARRPRRWTALGPRPRGAVDAVTRGRVVRVTGPLVELEGLHGVAMSDLVRPRASTGCPARSSRSAASG